MLDLTLSVLFSSLIFVIFKLFNTYKVETLYAIITNYVVACIVGILFYQGEISVVDIPQKPWFWYTFSLGLLFILVFNLMATTAQRNGVAVASVATKMSFVLPVLFGVYVYQEQLSVMKVIGIILALAAVYFASTKDKSASISKSSLLLPILVFIGSGLVDTSLKYIQESYIEEKEFAIFSSTVFASAAITGIVFLLLKAIKKPLKVNYLGASPRGIKKEIQHSISTQASEHLNLVYRVNFRNILGGIVLGVPNYFSIYFLLRALQNDTLNSASIFTINNVAIVMFSTLLGIVLFKEKISIKNWGGIILAVISIILVAFF